MKLDEKLVRLRKEKGLTQLELAEAVKVSRQAVSKWEAGGAVPSTDNLKGLSDLFGVPVDFLLNDEDEKKEDVISSSESSKGVPETTYKGKRKVHAKWVFIALIFLILIVSIGVIISNKYKENLHIGELKGEDIVTNRNFSVDW